MNKIVKITLKDDFANAYIYLENLKMQPWNVLRDRGQIGMYEFSRQMGFINRQADEKAENPFSNNFHIPEYQS